MITRNIVSRINNSKLMNFELFNKNKIIGTSNIMVDNIDNNSATINTLCIGNQYRNMGHGSTLLQGIEKCVKNEYNIKNVNLLAWQPRGSSEVFDLLKKNGYIEVENDDIDIYDDYDTIYDLIKFNKKI